MNFLAAGCLLLSMHYGVNGCLPGRFAYCPGKCGCSPCPAGTYQNDNGWQCYACPSGTYTPIQMSTSCLPCSASTCNTGYYFNCGGSYAGSCVQCLPGSYSASGAVSCSPCTSPLPANTFFTWRADASCPWQCNSGFYGDTAVNPSSCTACSTSNVGCNVGEYRPKCPDGATSSSQCEPCTNKPPHSTYTGVSGANDWISNCPYACDAGYFKTAEGYCCTICDNGYYNPNCSPSGEDMCLGCTNFS